jgi:2,3-bisphosphoglycerate-independent phosphoglycerate mutase
VPLLLATWQADSSSEEDFDEETSRRGALGVLRAGELAELLGLSRGSMTVSLRLPP